MNCCHNLRNGGLHFWRKPLAPTVVSGLYLDDNHIAWQPAESKIIKGFYGTFTLVSRAM